MLSYLVLSVAVLLPLASANYGPIGSCPAERVNRFIGALPNGDMCGAAYLAILSPPADGVADPSYAGALTLFCSSDCGQKITKFSASECGSDGLDDAFGFLLFCLPRENSVDRCRSVFPDLVESTLVASLGSCLNFTGTCPDGCASALTAAVTAFGCCYQIVYNNTELVTALATMGQLNSTDLDIVNATQNPALWTECSVPLQSPCDGDPFAGIPSIPFGVCSVENVTTFVTNSASATCGAAYTTLYLTPGVTDAQTNTALDTVCQSDCAGSVAAFLDNTCQDRFTSTLTNITCSETDGSIGDRCLFVDNVETSVYEAVGACFAPGDCPAGCADALQGLKDNLGCCYQSLYNDTNILQLLFFNFTITFEDLGFFKAISKPGIWNGCDVSLQEACSDPFVEAGALKFAASSVVMLVSLIILPLML